MLIEKFVSQVVKFKNNSYLHFDPSLAGALPILQDKSSPLMMYIHIPFCEKQCSYCSFHKVNFEPRLAKSYFKAIQKEIKMYKELNYNFSAVYFGGGTPTVLMPELLETISLLKTNFNIEEISVETNPNHLDIEHLQPLKDIGISRLSVGVQSFDDEILKATGRLHKYGSGGEIKAKINEFMDYFPTFNVDMMFNFPIQSHKSLKKDLEIINLLKPSQVTYYPLMVSSSTAKNIEKSMGSIKEKRGRSFYKTITNALDKNYNNGTAWCFNRKNIQKEKPLIDEYVINFDQYAGVGSGAFGYINGSIYANTFSILNYIKSINDGVFPIIAKKDFTKREQLLYDFLMQLFGMSLNLDRISEKYKINARVHLFFEILFFKIIGAIRTKKGNNTLYLKDRYYWVIMMREFFSSVNNFRDYCRKKEKGG